MATGDILSCSIDSSGWYANITIEGLSTGGTYDFGYGSDFDPDDANVVFTLTSETFNGTGGTTTKQRTIRATKEKRQAYPNDSYADESVSGSDVIVRVALSEWIYDDDSSITVDIAGGVYTQGGTPNNSASGLSVTNNSTQGYFSAIANWSVPLHGRRMGFDELFQQNDTSGYFGVRVMAYHRDGAIPCIKVTAEGQSSSHTETIYLTSESIDDDTYNDALPIAEYIGLIDISSFTQGESVDIDFIAYPAVGDSSNILDTSAIGESMPSSWPCTQTVICDKSHTYGTAVAVVDGTYGNDGTGAVTDLDSFDPESPPNAYQTIYAAINAIRTYNNSNYSRDEYGGGIVFVQAGNYAFLGGTISAQASATYIQITPFPGVSRSSVAFTTQTGSRAAGTYLMLNNITINESGNLVNGSIYAWFHKVDFTATATTQQYTSPGMQIFTGCDISSLNQGFCPYSTTEVYTFVRGCAIDTILEIVAAHMYIGNHSTSGNVRIRDYFNSALGVIDGEIIGFNFVYVGSDDYGLYLCDDDIAGNSYGAAIVNNVFEKPTLGTVPLFWIAADGTDEYTVQNILIWHNTIVGARSNLAYNDINLNGGNPAPRLGWSIKGTLFDDFNMITDNDSHGGSPDGARTGNHSIVHGCGLVGNIYAEQVGTSIQTPDFLGLMCVAGTLVTPVDMDFVDNNSSTGDGTGNGDYHLNATSPAIGLIFEKILNYDIDEVARIVDGAAGAYEYISGTTYNMSMSESSSISDALGGLASFIGSMAESNSITDSITSLANFLLSLSESSSISDAFTSTAEFIRSIAESASINDVESAALEFTSNISESTNISDAFTSLIDFIGTLTDNPTITDLYSGIIGYYHTISESVSISDQISGLKDAIGTIAEVSTITDDLSSIANMLVSIAESNNIQDTLAAIGIFAHTINESATIEDAFRIIGGIIEFVKIFGEVNLDSLIRGAIKDQGKISGEVDKQNIIRGEVDDNGN